MCFHGLDTVSVEASAEADHFQVCNFASPACLKEQRGRKEGRLRERERKEGKERKEGRLREKERKEGRLRERERKDGKERKEGRFREKERKEGRLREQTSRVLNSKARGTRKNTKSVEIKWTKVKKMWRGGGES